MKILGKLWRQRKLPDSLFLRVALSIALLCTLAAIFSFLHLIPWTQLYSPDSSWTSLAHSDYGPKTVTYLGVFAMLTLLFWGFTLILAAGWMHHWIGKGIGILVGRLTIAVVMLAMAVSSCLLINLDRSVEGTPAANNLILPRHGPQLAIAFFLHGADADGIIITVPTICGIFFFGLVTLILARRLVQHGPRWLNWIAMGLATTVACGCWVATDRMLGGSPLLPLSQTAYVWIIMIVLKGMVPAAYLLLIGEVAGSQVGDFRRQWQEQRWRRWAGSTIALSGLVIWIVMTISPILSGMYLSHWNTPASASTILDHNGNVLTYRHPADRPLRLTTDDIPITVFQAMDAIEDPGIYASPETHSPLNLVTVLGSMLRAASGGRSGASGIASQTCKQIDPLVGVNIPGIPDFVQRLVFEKAYETPCAWYLEEVNGTRKTMVLWLNTVNFACLGNEGLPAEIIGIEAASQVFFNKHAADLTTAEAATLVRLPRMPCAYDAWQNPEAVTEGRNDILHAMAYRQHYLSPEEAYYLATLPLDVGEKPYSPPNFAEPFVEQAMTSLDEQGLHGFSTSGNTVETTLDPDLQPSLEGACMDAIAAQDTNGANDCGAILLSRDPANPETFIVTAYVGTIRSISDDHAVQDLVVSQPMPVGSAIKGPLYACALDHQVLQPDEILNDTEGAVIGGKKVGNWDQTSWGDAPASEMLSGSRNVPAGRLVDRLTPDGFTQCLTDQFDVQTDIDEEWGVELGLGKADMHLWDLAVAYTPFATGGLVSEPFYVRQVTDRDGKVILNTPSPSVHRAVSCATSAWVTNALLDVGQNYGFLPGIALKTGSLPATSTAVAYTQDWVLAVWVGRSVPNEPLQAGDFYPEASDVAREFTNAVSDKVTVPDFSPCPVERAKVPTPDSPSSKDPAPTSTMAPTLPVDIPADSPTATIVPTQEGSISPATVNQRDDALTCLATSIERWFEEENTPHACLGP